jgi:hypothetical protein
LQAIRSIRIDSAIRSARASLPHANFLHTLNSAFPLRWRRDLQSFARCLRNHRDCHRDRSRCVEKRCAIGISSSSRNTARTFARIIIIDMICARSKHDQAQHMVLV